MKIFFLLIFWSLWFLNHSSRSVFSPLLPIIEEELTLTHAMAGSLFIFSSVGYTIALILGGSLSPRAGYKRTIIAGYLIVSIAHFFLRQAQSYWSLAVFLLFIGLGSGIFMPSMLPIVTATFGRRNWGKAIAAFDSGAPFSIFAVPILVAISLRFLYWRGLFLILSGACLAGLIVFWLFSPDPQAHREERVRFADVLHRRDFRVMAMLWSFASAASVGVYNVIPLFLVKERGMPLELANTIFGISRVGGLFVPLLPGFLADRYGARNILFLVFLITGISTIMLALARDFTLLMVVLVVQATASVGFFPVGLLTTSKLTTFKERSIFLGGTMALGVIGGGLTPLGLGAVADIWNFQIGILVLGVLASVSCLLVRNLEREIDQ